MKEKNIFTINTSRNKTNTFKNIFQKYLQKKKKIINILKGVSIYIEFFS